MTQEEIEKYFLRCEFDDECEMCDDPQEGSYAVGYTNDEYGEEVDYYICGKCAPSEIEKIKKQDEQLAKWAEEEADKYNK